MSRTVPMRLNNGYLYVETDEVEPEIRPAEDPRSVSNFEDTPEDAELVGFQEDFAKAAVTLHSTINALAADVADALSKAAPTEWSLQFNIGFKGKASPIPVLLSGEGSAALKLTATWRRE